MYNTDLPQRADLPTKAQLRRSTLIAGLAAVAILTTIVLPAEYAIDPTRIGGVLGLTEMGRIKTQIAAEASRVKAAAAAPAEGREPTATGAQVAELAARLDRIEQGLDALRTPAPQAEPAAFVTADVTNSVVTQAEEPKAAPAADGKPRGDKLVFTLIPGQVAEVKLVMRKGAKAKFAWSSSGALNCDLHGDAPGQKASYQRGRGVAADQGGITAAFDGNHGWFWRNRGTSDVKVTLEASGDYAAMNRLL